MRANFGGCARMGPSTYFVRGNKEVLEFPLYWHHKIHCICQCTTAASDALRTVAYQALLLQDRVMVVQVLLLCTSRLSDLGAVNI